MRKRLVSLWMACAHGVVGTSGVMADVTDLTVTKSGNDVVLSWTTGTAPYSVSLSNSSPTFAQVQTLALGISSTSFTYTGGLTNNKALQFFQVCDTIEDCMAFAYTGGAVPPPAPQVGSVSPTGALKVGDILTINGSGFSTVPTADRVLFPQGITVIANSSPAPTETSFQVTVPRGAVSGTFRVQVGFQLSDPYSFTVYAQTGFTHVYGMSYQPTTTDIWLTDGGSASNYSKCYSMTYNSGTGVWDKTARETALNATPKYLGGQGFDSGGYYYYGLNNASAGGGVRRAQSNPPGPGGSFTQVGTGDSISVAALATSPAFTNQVFVAYYDQTTPPTSPNQVKGVKLLGGTPIQDYGGFGSAAPNLAPIAGLALDSSGNLYLSATTQIIKITSSTSHTTLCSGFTRAEGISLYQSGAADAGTLLVVDNGTSTLYSVNLNDPSPTPQPILSGLSIPRTASFVLSPLAAAPCSALPNSLFCLVLAGEDTQPRQVASAPITIEPHDPTCLWISKQQGSDQYPAPSFQGSDHQVVVTATVNPLPTQATTVCFRVVDPPDTAPYSDGSTTGFWCDNKEPAGNNGGKLWKASSGTWETVVCVPTDTNGKASVVLNTSNRYAGDNYIVQASFDNWGGGATTPAMTETGIISNWKRIYIEKDKMFKRGGVLYSDFNKSTCSPNCNQITVYDWANVAKNDVIVVFDEHYTAETGGETRTVAADPHNNGDGTVTLTLDADLTNDCYVASTSTGTSPPMPDFANYDGAGIGVIGSSYYEADLGAMWQTYEEAFVEYLAPPDGTGAMPFLPQTWFDWAITPSPGPNSVPLSSFSQAWFKHKNGSGNTNSPQNYYHVMGVSATSSPLGLSSPDSDASYIFLDTITAACSSCSAGELQNHIRETTVHELARQFRVNGCSPPDYLDSNNAWCGNPGGSCVNPTYGYQYCIMHSADSNITNMRKSGITHLDCDDLDANGAACGVPACAGGISVRTDTDPE